MNEGIIKNWSPGTIDGSKNGPWIKSLDQKMKITTRSQVAVVSFDVNHLKSPSAHSDSTGSSRNLMGGQSQNVF